MIKAVAKALIALRSQEETRMDASHLAGFFYAWTSTVS